MRIVLEIAGAGAVLLFAALGALVSLMYLLTNPIFGEPARERRRARRRARRMNKRTKRGGIRKMRPDVGAGADSAASAEGGGAGSSADTLGLRAAPAGIDAGELDRRRRAAALAAAIACADSDRLMVFSEDAPADWRLLHRNLRLRQSVARRGART